MFGPTLDTAIGIAFVFFLFSSLLTIVMEIIAGGLKLRAKALEDSISRLIANPNAPGDVTTIGRAMGLFQRFGAATNAVNGVANMVGAAAVAQAKAAVIGGAGDVQTAAATAAKAVTDAAKAADVHPNLATLSQTITTHPLLRGSDNDDAPSYVPATNFSAALISAIGPASNAFADIKQAVENLPDNTSLKSTLQALILQAQTGADRTLGDVDAFKAGVETWFDAAMDRLSGDYKRFTQVITFALGLSIAVLLNVDAIRLVQRLYAEPALRTSVDTLANTAVAAGVNSVTAPTPKQAPGATPGANTLASGTNAVANTTAPAANAVAPKPDDPLTAQVAQAAKVGDQLWKIGPIGWAARPVWDFSQDGAATLLGWICGWLLTALAGLLGAPFWFDALSGLVNIRNAGPKPSSSTAAGSQPATKPAKI